MSEAVENSPLEIVRGLEATGRRLDAVVQGYLEQSPEMLDQLSGQLGALNFAHPWAGQEVTVFGTPLTISTGQENPTPYTLPADTRPITARGLYNGLTIRRLYDAEEDRYGHKLVHMVYTDSTPMALDEYGRIHQMHYYDYLCLKGSEVVPVLPIDAHSARDLAGDPVVAVVDEIASDQDANGDIIITRLGSEVNAALKEVKFEPVELNHQRASYINSLGMHEMVALQIEDLLLGSVEDELKDFEHRFLSETGDVIPGILQIAPGYDRLPGTNEPLRGGPPELYARVDLTDDRMILLAALKNVCGVKSLSGL